VVELETRPSFRQVQPDADVQDDLTGAGRKASLPTQWSGMVRGHSSARVTPAITKLLVAIKSEGKEAAAALRLFRSSRPRWHVHDHPWNNS
jgi:hypothetical protein